MDKKTERLAIKIFGNLLFGITVYGFIIVLSLPTIILFTQLGNYDLQDLSIFIQIIALVVFAFAFLVTGAIQIVWAWILLSFADSMEKKIPVTQSLKNYKEQWNNTLKEFLKDKYDVD